MYCCLDHQHHPRESAWPVLSSRASNALLALKVSHLSGLSVYGASLSLRGSTLGTVIGERVCGRKGVWTLIHSQFVNQSVICLMVRPVYVASCFFSVRLGLGSKMWKMAHSEQAFALHKYAHHAVWLDHCCYTIYNGLIIS